MRITEVHLKNFKRFTALSIDHIPADTKLVLLIGTNGSGKSSVFDAFGYINNRLKEDDSHDEAYRKYFKKNKSEDIEIELRLEDGKMIKVGEHNYDQIEVANPSFYGRTSFRQVPRLTRTSSGQGGWFDLERDSDRPRLFIERDERFENDIEKITEVMLKDFFRSRESNEQIRNKCINPINDALKNILGEGRATTLQLTEIIPPLEGKIAQINFQKGASEIHYNYLSAGEKEVFNLLSRSKNYQNTIYFLDEIDLHLNTKLQFDLIKEINEHWIPPNCQLWIATHSLGFIEYAKQTENAVIINFDDLNFDLPQTLTPEPKDNPDVYDIAVGKEFLSSLFQDKEIYFVENKDKEYYAGIGIPNTIFVSDNNRNNVFHKVRPTHYCGIVDRDFLSDSDIEEIRKEYPKLTILHYYSIENYLYHPDNLEEYYKKANRTFDKADYIHQLTEAKNQVKDTLTSFP